MHKVSRADQQEVVPGYSLSPVRCLHPAQLTYELSDDGWMSLNGAFQVLGVMLCAAVVCW